MDRVEIKIRAEMKKRGVTIYRLSKDTGIKYELLRRMFCGERKMSANELVLILDKTDIAFEDIK